MPQESDGLEGIFREVGRFVVFMGDLEMIAYAAVRNLAPGSKGKALAEQEVHKRFTTLLGLSRSKAGTPEWDNWINVWERGLSLVQDRKRIVHNPLVVDVWESPTRGFVTTPFRLLQFRNLRPQQRTLCIEYIVSEASKAEEVSKRAYELWSEVFPGLSIFQHIDDAQNATPPE